MLKEKQVQFSDNASEHWFARIFSDEDSWLTVFYDRARQPLRFTYVEDVRTDIKACLQWSPQRGIQFHRIDSGESSPLANRSPVSTGTLPFDHECFASAFNMKAEQIDPEVRSWIIQRLSEIT